MRVLIVDDDAASRRLLESRLSVDERFEVVGEAENGAVAVARAAHLNPDLVLMDVSMPVMDGLEAAAKITAAAPEITVVIVSGIEGDDAADAIAAHEAGVSGRLMKSDFSVSALISILDA